MVSISVRYFFLQPVDEKIKTWTLRFPAKENPNMEKALFDWAILLRYDVKAKYRLIPREFSGMKFFHPSVRTNQPKATRVCKCSTNQSNRSICVRLLFLFCSRVFSSRSYENRSIQLDYIKFIIDESRAEGRDGKRRREIFLPIILRSRFQYPALKSKLPTLVEGRFWDHKEQETHLSLLSMFNSLSFCPMSTCNRSIASCSSECDVIRLSIVLESLALFSLASLSERCRLSI